MSNFTEQELQTAVSQFVRSEIKTSRDQLGTLDVDYSFSEVREYVASTLVFDPSAVFYLLSLAANRVNQDVLTAVDYLSDLQTAILEVGRDTTRVTSTNLLEDAAAALLEVDRLILTKNVLTERPLIRYRNALSKFTTISLAPNIRSVTGSGFPETYEIVRPPPKAQEAIRSAVQNLRELHEMVIDEMEQLSVAMTEFLDANLPLVAIQSSIGKVRVDLRKLKQEFDSSSTDDDAISLTRDAYLRISAGESVINNLSTVSDPRESRMHGTSVTTDRAQAAFGSDSTVTAACVTTGLSAPWEVGPATNELELSVDGGAPVTVTLPVDDEANIVGCVPEPYDIHAAAAAQLTASAVGPYTVPSSPNNVFTIYVDGSGYQATLTSGSRTAAQIAAQMNPATRTDGTPGTLADVAIAEDDGTHALRFRHLTVGPGSLVIGDQATLNAAVKFTNGQDSDDAVNTRGVAANNKIRFLVDDVYEVDITLTSGAARTAAQVAADIDGRAFVQATAATREIIGGTDTVVEVASETHGAGSVISPYPVTVVHEAAMATLGFFEHQTDRANYTDSDEAAAAIEQALPDVAVDLSERVIQEGSDGVARLEGVDYVLDVGVTGTLLPEVGGGQSLFISQGVNAGWYRVEGVVSLDAGTRDGLVVQRAFPSVVLPQASSQLWSVQERLMTIRSVGESLSSSLEVGFGSANMALGLTEQTVIGQTSGLKIVQAGTILNVQRYDVREGDIVFIGSGLSVTSHIVEAITESGYQMELTPSVPMSIIGELYEVWSAASVAYEAFYSQLSDWQSTLASSRFAQDILYLERSLNPLLYNKNPSSALVNDALAAASALADLYSKESSLAPGATQILAGFTVFPVPRIDSLLNMLIERGLDRAHDLLLLGRFTDFFSSGKDDGSYGGNMLQAMRSVAQKDLPVGRSDEENHVDRRLVSSVTEADADWDYSDRDDETGFIETDDIPDYDGADDLLRETY